MRNHHELPKYYLRGFCEPATSFLWVFERDQPYHPGKKRGVNNPHKRGLRKAALRADAYAFKKPNGTLSYEYELKLQQKEKRADLTIRKVRNLETIDKSGKEILTQYIWLTWRRLTSRDDVVLSLIDKHLKQSSLEVCNLSYLGEFNKARQLQDALDLLHSEERKTEMIRMTMLRDFVKVHSHLMRMRWEFIKVATDHYFVTTDNPVVFDKHAGLRASPLIFPISQAVILVAGQHAGVDLSYREASPLETLKLNAMIIRFAEREVYSPGPDEWVHRGLAEGFSFTE